MFAQDMLETFIQYTSHTSTILREVGKVVFPADNAADISDRIRKKFCTTYISKTYLEKDLYQPILSDFHNNIMLKPYLTIVIVKTSIPKVKSTVLKNFWQKICAAEHLFA